MFTLQSPLTSNNQSSVSKKKDLFHKSRAIEEKQKIRRTFRFEALIDDLFHKNIADNLQSIKESSIEQIQKKLTEYMQKEEYLKLALLVIDCKQSLYFQQILNQQWIQKFVKFSSGRLFKPQIIIVFRILSQFHSNFSQVIGRQIWVIKQLTNQIQNLKLNRYQQIYLNILQLIIPKYSKRNTDVIINCFDNLSQLINNEIIPIKTGIRLLKQLCQYIQEDKQISIPLISRITKCYQDQVEQHQYEVTQTMINCFIVFTMIIFNQKNIDIVTSLNIIKTLIHARKYLPSKFIQQYTNFFKLLYVILKKIALHQIQLPKNQFAKQRQKLTKINRQLHSQIVQNSHYPLTTLLVDLLLNENSFLLDSKEFKTQYVAFIDVVVQYTDYRVFQHFFQKYQCIEHPDNQIVYISLHVIHKILSLCQQPYRILTKLKDQYSIVPILEQKLMNLNNIIAHKSNQILQILDNYHP